MVALRFPYYGFETLFFLELTSSLLGIVVKDDIFEGQVAVILATRVPRALLLASHKLEGWYGSKGYGLLKKLVGDLKLGLLDFFIGTLLLPLDVDQPNRPLLLQGRLPFERVRFLQGQIFFTLQLAYKLIHEKVFVCFETMQGFHELRE